MAGSSTGAVIEERRGPLEEATWRPENKSQELSVEGNVDLQFPKEQTISAEAESYSNLTAETGNQAEAESYSNLAAEKENQAEAESYSNLAAEKENQAEAESYSNLAAEKENQTEAESYSNLAAEKENQTEAESYSNLATEKENQAEAESYSNLTAEMENRTEADSFSNLAAKPGNRTEAAEADSSSLTNNYSGEISECDSDVEIISHSCSRASESVHTLNYLKNMQDEMGERKSSFHNVSNESSCDSSPYNTNFGKNEEQNLNKLENEVLAQGTENESNSEITETSPSHAFVGDCSTSVDGASHLNLHTSNETPVAMVDLTDLTSKHLGGIREDFSGMEDSPAEVRRDCERSEPKWKETTESSSSSSIIRQNNGILPIRVALSMLASSTEDLSHLTEAKRRNLKRKQMRQIIAAARADNLGKTQRKKPRKQQRREAEGNFAAVGNTAGVLNTETDTRIKDSCRISEAGDKISTFEICQERVGYVKIVEENKNTDSLPGNVVHKTSEVSNETENFNQLNENQSKNLRDEQQTESGCTQLAGNADKLLPHEVIKEAKVLDNNLDEKCKVHYNIKESNGNTGGGPYDNGEGNKSNYDCSQMVEMTENDSDMEIVFDSREVIPECIEISDDETPTNCNPEAVECGKVLKETTNIEASPSKGCLPLSVEHKTWSEVQSNKPEKAACFNQNKSQNWRDKQHNVSAGVAHQLSTSKVSPQQTVNLQTAGNKHSRVLPPLNVAGSNFTFMTNQAENSFDLSKLTKKQRQNLRKKCFETPHMKHIWNTLIKEWTAAKHAKRIANGMIPLSKSQKRTLNQALLSVGIVRGTLTPEQNIKLRPVQAEIAAGNVNIVASDVFQKFVAEVREQKKSSVGASVKKLKQKKEQTNARICAQTSKVNNSPQINAVNAPKPNNPSQMKHSFINTANAPKAKNSPQTKHSFINAANAPKAKNSPQTKHSFINAVNAPKAKNSPQTRNTFINVLNSPKATNSSQMRCSSTNAANPPKRKCLSSVDKRISKIQKGYQSWVPSSERFVNKPENQEAEKNVLMRNTHTTENITQMPSIPVTQMPLIPVTQMPSIPVEEATNPQCITQFLDHQLTLQNLLQKNNPKFTVRVPVFETPDEELEFMAKHFKKSSDSVFRGPDGMDLPPVSGLTLSQQSRDLEKNPDLPVPNSPIFSRSRSPHRSQSHNSRVRSPNKSQKDTFRNSKNLIQIHINPGPHSSNANAELPKRSEGLGENSPREGSPQRSRDAQLRGERSTQPRDPLDDKNLSKLN